MIRVMLSIPPNTGWVEPAYSVLEDICQRRQKRLRVGSLKYQFFLAVLKLPVRHSFVNSFFEEKTFKQPLLLELTVLYFPSIERFTKRHYLHNLQDF